MLFFHVYLEHFDGYDSLSPSSAVDQPISTFANLFLKDELFEINLDLRVQSARGSGVRRSIKRFSVLSDV